MEMNMILVMYNKSEIKFLGKRRLIFCNFWNKKKYIIEFVIVGGIEFNLILGVLVIKMMKFIIINEENFVV